MIYGRAARNNGKSEGPPMIMELMQHRDIEVHIKRQRNKRKIKNPSSFLKRRLEPLASA
jgi:hypothetical protein